MPTVNVPCIYNLSTRTTSELAARRAIRAIEGKDIKDVSEYINPDSSNYKKMINWIAQDLGVDSLQYQRVDDMVKAIGLPKERLCLYCWLGTDFQQNEKPSSSNEKIQQQI